MLTDRQLLSTRYLSKTYISLLHATWYQSVERERQRDSSTSSVNHRKRSTRVEVRNLRNVWMMRTIRFSFVIVYNQGISCLIENILRFSIISFQDNLTTNITKTKDRMYHIFWHHNKNIVWTKKTTYSVFNFKYHLYIILNAIYFAQFKKDNGIEFLILKNVPHTYY